MLSGCSQSRLGYGERWERAKLVLSGSGGSIERVRRCGRRAWRESESSPQCLHPVCALCLLALHVLRSPSVSVHPLSPAISIGLFVRVARFRLQFRDSPVWAAAGVASHGRQGCQRLRAFAGYVLRERENRCPCTRPPYTLEIYGTPKVIAKVDRPTSNFLLLINTILRIHASDDKTVCF